MTATTNRAADAQIRPRPSDAPRPPLPSTFACKVTMAVTGWVFAAFVAVHMVGNLKAFAGAASYNSYSHWLRNALYPLLPHEGLLWILRVVLAVSLVLHVGASAVLWARGRRFRGPHRRRAYSAWGARTMPWTGLILLAFVVFHLLDLTLGIAGPVTYQAATATESFAFQNTVASLSRPLAGGFYLASMLALALHLAHGLWSTTSDLGVTGHRTRAAWLIVAYALAVAVALGNASLPIAVWLGVLA
ncbi:MAG TPA: succinate dehydrogenase cytochrome b subunit [Propionibacteriaceae bacterium]|nr:succinate dehydrogenase cytochrome b subunit [Propionibacteriaceae bacterium]